MDTPQVLLEHYLKQLKLPTMLREYAKLAEQCAKMTGYEEISLLSLSSGDYSQIEKTLGKLIEIFRKGGICISLPSLRVEKALKEFPAVLGQIKKSGLTFAPEAGTERLRLAINKKIDIGELREAVKAACREGWMGIKLYFMVGLPTERQEDIEGIVKIIDDLLTIDRRLRINVTINAFVPKPHTPFQSEAMDRKEELQAKMSYILRKAGKRRVHLKFQDIRLSILEAILSGGDRRVGRAILKAYNRGCRLDGWIEHLRFDEWMAAFKEEGIDPEFYIYRAKKTDEALPWGHIDTSLTF